MTRRALLCMLLAGLAGGSVGCAQISPVLRSGSRAAIQYAVARYLGEDPQRAQEARRIIVEVRPLAQGAATLDALAQAVEARIPWQRLDLADAVLLAELLTVLRDELERRIGSGLLDPGRVERIEQVLDWIDAAAQRVEARA